MSDSDITQWYPQGEIKDGVPDEDHSVLVNPMRHKCENQWSGVLLAGVAGGLHGLLSEARVVESDHLSPKARCQSVDLVG